jgi:hypothetical protein
LEQLLVVTLDYDFIKNGIIAGVSWFVINIAFDTMILVPMMKSTFAAYFMSIGLGYVAIPVISIAIGYTLDRKVKVVTKL